MEINKISRMKDLLISKLMSEKKGKSIFGCRMSMIPEIVILTPIDFIFEKIINKIDNKECFEGLYNVVIGEINNHKIAIINTGIGSANVGNCIFLLQFTRCKYVIFIGEVGAISEALKVGDILIATAAVREHGCAEQFVDLGYPAVCSFEILNAIYGPLKSFINKLNKNILLGIVYSTDFFVTESQKQVLYLQKINIAGVDMETSTLYTISNIFGLKPLSILVVSDELYAGEILVTDKHKERFEEETIEKIPMIVERVIEVIVNEGIS